nr:hypothetical protein [Tanacetum cinerariifolium]
MPNLEGITDPTTAMNMALTLMAKSFKLNYLTPTNNNQRISSNTRNREIAQPSMNMGQDRQMQRVQNVKNQNGLIGVQGNGNQNQIGNGNHVAARAEGNAAGQNANQIRCYNCRGVGNGNQSQIGNGNLAAARAEGNAAGKNANQIRCYNCRGNLNGNGNLVAAHPEGNVAGHNEEQYTELLEPIPESHQLPYNDHNVISEVTSVEQSGETVEQHLVNFEETRALYDTLYQNLAIEVEKVNTVNCKLKETNADLTTELVGFKNQEKCFKISQEKYD